MGNHLMNGNGVTGNGSLNKRASGSCRSLERLARGPGRVSVFGEQANIQVPPPFRGGLSSQMLCSSCGHKSVVRYDKFDSITLNLSANKTQAQSLGQLMSEFISPETLNDVECESCNTVASHTKTLTFGKLPSCLCIHISRTTWLPSGYAYKRQDFVHFPESLSMAPYSFIQPGLSSTANTPWGSTLSLYSSSLPTAGGLGDGGFNLGSYGIGGMFPRNLYRLLAVIVHSGEANSGHFITYRRGALRNSHRWYYTSDTVVKEVEIEEVLSCPAYILFYDRGGQKMATANQ
jgi:ubiquitin carboxyl-terminal hydrolase 30